MSNTLFQKWIDFLFFGSKECPSSKPPLEILPILTRLDAEGIHWEEMGQQGGLTLFPYHIAGDLDVLLEHLNNNDQLPTFKSGTVRRFCDHLLTTLARRQAVEQPKPSLHRDDQQILKAILDEESGPFSYQSATFWGELARRLLLSRRPFQDDFVPLHSIPSARYRRLFRLYQLTCETLGQWLDPFSMYLVPAEDYLDSVHWQSPRLLEMFLREQSQHVLARSIQRLLKNVIGQILNGQRPTCLDPYPLLDIFLENINRIHGSIPQVEHADIPPKTIDTIHRLLALAERDDLWSSQQPHVPTEEHDLDDRFHLLQRIHLLERQNFLLMQRIPHEFDSSSGTFECVSCMKRTPAVTRTEQCLERRHRPERFDIDNVRQARIS